MKEDQLLKVYAFASWVVKLQEMHSDGRAGYGFGYRPEGGTLFVTIDSTVN